jgi:ABC-type dipeptide/oligopeptide/nickel transport system permease subunit
LLSSILLSPLAVGINTIVGFTVGHWVADVNRKTTSYIVSVVDIGLCFIAVALALWPYRQMGEADDAQPELGRRRFMAKLAMTLAIFALVVIVAQTLAPITLHPRD